MGSDKPPEPLTVVAVLLVGEDDDHSAGSLRPTPEEFEEARRYCGAHGLRLYTQDVAVLRIAADGTLIDTIGLPARDTDSPSRAFVFVLGPCPDLLPKGVYEFLRAEIEAGVTVHCVEWGELSREDLDAWFRQGSIPGRSRLGRQQRRGRRRLERLEQERFQEERRRTRTDVSGQCHVA